MLNILELHFAKLSSSYIPLVVGVDFVVDGRSGLGLFLRLFLQVPVVYNGDLTIS